MFNNFILSALRIFFHFLYHQFAWSYDIVSWIVSIGRWRRWVISVMDVIESPIKGRILEIGHGPGHLQLELHHHHIWTVGVDESPWMSRQAYRRITDHHYPPRLATGVAQSLPFNSSCFDYVIATFPSEYLVAGDTLKEVCRVLKPNGIFVILLYALITGKNTLDRFAAWLFQVTGQSPDSDVDIYSEKIKDIFDGYGFIITPHIIELDGSKVMVIEATKKNCH